MRFLAFDDRSFEENGEGSFNLTLDSISRPLIVRRLIESDTRSWDSAAMRTRKTCLPLARLPACSRGRLCLHNVPPIFLNYPTDKNTRPDSLWIIVDKPFLFVSLQIYFRLSLSLSLSLARSLARYFWSNDSPRFHRIDRSTSENRWKVTLFKYSF